MYYTFALKNRQERTHSIYLEVVKRVAEGIKLLSEKGSLVRDHSEKWCPSNNEISENL